MDAAAGLSKGVVAGHIKQAAALNAQSVHKVNVELVEKPVSGPVHMPLLKPCYLH